MTSQPVKSADRTLEILEALAADGPRTLGDLVRALGIPKSSLHGILRTMALRGWVETDPTGTRFGLGLKALQVGSAYLDSDDAVGLLGGILDDLAARFGETVHLGRLDGPFVVYVAKRESRHPLRLYSAIGRRLPAHATALGKALLAERPTAEVDGLLPDPLPRLTPHTITDRASLFNALTRIKVNGSAIDREENTEGIICVARAVPLKDPATDAVSLSVPAPRMTPEMLSSMEKALADTVDRVRAARALLA